MEEMLFFIIIYSILVFIWSYSLARRQKRDSATRAFLLFLGVILIWMLLSISDFFRQTSLLFLVMQKASWLVLLNLATFFLYFIYRLIERKLDLAFLSLISLNTITILIRYLMKLDYNQANFWRLSDPLIATIMAAIFTLPMLWAIILVIKTYRETTIVRIKKSIRHLVYGTSLATAISILSEYVGPTFLPGFETRSLMYLAILVLVIFLVLAVVKEQFLNVEMEYIYAELFLNSSEGIVLIDQKGKVLSVNQSAIESLNGIEIAKDSYLSDLLLNYDFERDNIRYEITEKLNGEINHLILSQNIIEMNQRNTMKLLHIVNITEEKQARLAKLALLSDKSLKDQQTSLYNRRYLEECFPADKEQDQDLTVIFIDVDNLKLVNDTRGHIVGDEVIKLVAQTIKDSIRSNEIALRYGGDEFIIILEEISPEDAAKIAKRIGEIFLANLTPECEILNTLSLSVGISSGKKDIRTLIHEADLAMYASKNRGKNQCTIYSEKILAEIPQGQYCELEED